MKLLNNYLPVFKFIIRSTLQPDPAMDYDDFRQKCIACLEKAVTNAERTGCSDRECDDAFLAVVVWLDEFIIRSTLSYKIRWLGELLQHRYFQIATGGTAFFEHLNRIPDGQKSARYVYLFCLRQGFQGQFAGQNAARLNQIIQRQQRICLPESWTSWPNDAVLIPSAMNKNKTKLSIWHKPLWLCVGGTGIVFLLTFLILFFYCW